MKEYEILLLKELLATIYLHRFQMEYDNDYVYGSDDIIRLITEKIKIYENK